MYNPHLAKSQTQQLEDCCVLIDELKEKELTPYNTIQQFNEWNDIFISFIDNNEIKMDINESNLFLHGDMLNDYAIYFMKNDLQKQIKYIINDKLSTIPKAYLNILIEQFIFETLHNMYNKHSQNFKNKKNKKTKKDAVLRIANESISHIFNSYLLFTFSVLDWTEKYRILYDDEIYLGFITKCGAYIIIPRYHEWCNIYEITKRFNNISLNVHGGITFFEQDISIFCFYKEMQNETKLCLENSVCIGWDYHHSSMSFYAKPAYDIGVKLTFDSIENDVLKAIQSAKCCD